MPWEIVKRFGKFCIVKPGSDEEPEGCHSTRAEAVAQMKALYASESNMAADVAANESNLAAKISYSVGDIEDAVAHLKLAIAALVEESQEDLPMHLEEALAALGEYGESDPLVASSDRPEHAWSGPIVFENVVTGDNRVFKSGSIVWEDDTLPWTLRWQKHSGQGHAGSVPVGRVDKIERKEDGSIFGYGVVIPSLNDEAGEYLRLLESGVGGGVSVDGDSAQFEIQEMAEGGQPRIEFSAMRLRALSAVDIPAFNGARIRLTEISEGETRQEASEETLQEGDTEEFFNKNHDADGRFAPAAGGTGKAPKGQGGRGLGKNAYGGIPAKFKGREGAKAQRRLVRSVTKVNRASNPDYKKVVSRFGAVRLDRLHHTDLGKFDDKQLGDLHETLKLNYRGFNNMRKVGWVRLNPIQIGVARFKLNHLTPQISRVHIELGKRKVKHDPNFGLVDDEVLEFQVGEPISLEQEIAAAQEMLDKGQTEDDTSLTDEDREEGLEFLMDLLNASDDDIDDDIPSEILEKLRSSKDAFSSELDDLAAETEPSDNGLSELELLEAELEALLREIDAGLTPAEREALRHDDVRQSGMTNGWNVDQTLVAAAIPVSPSTEAFLEPEFDGPSALTVSPDGKVSGHLALFNTCHIGFPGACVKPPKGSNYQYFHTGEIETAEGDLVSVGHLTFKTGHAAMHASPKAAAEHYDNTGTVAADVRAGEDQFGIWVVGALRNHLSEEDIRAFRSAPLSGDWRRIAGKLELVGALAVNVPGFPVPRVKALVASGETETLFTYLEDGDENFPDQEPGSDSLSLDDRLETKTTLAQRLEVAFADESDVPHEKISDDDLPDPPSRKEFVELAKKMTKAQLLGHLKDIRDFLDDPDADLAETDRKKIEKLYGAFIATDEKGKKTDASGMDVDEFYSAWELSGMDIEEFYNTCHSPEDGKFCPGGDGKGGSGLSGQARSGKPGGKPGAKKPGYVPCGPGQYFDHASGTCKAKGKGPGGPGGPGKKGGRSSPSAIKEWQNYKKAKRNALGWAAVTAVAAAVQHSDVARSVLTSITTPFGIPILGSPAFAAAMLVAGAINSYNQSRNARKYHKQFNVSIDKIDKADRDAAELARLKAKQAARP